MKFSKTIVPLLILLFVPEQGYAKLDFEDHAFPEFVTSARALAMGNAYLNKVDDSWSAFYNPAGLGTVRRPQFHLLNAHMEASNTMLNIASSGPGYKIPQKYMDTFDIANVRTELGSRQGKLAHSRFNLFPNITLRGLTLGYMFSQRNRAIINDDVANNFEFNERRDQGPVMSLAASLFGGVVKVGATAVYLTRKELYKELAPATPTSTVQSSDYKSGQGLQVTVGSRLTLPFDLLPTFSFVIRNATNKRWENPGQGGEPERIKQTADVGFSITPQVGKTSRLHLEANLKDVSNSYNTDSKRRLAAGAELDFNRRIFLRAGWGDGWGSGGIGVRSRTFILDISTYAVDRSLDDFRKLEDRRWVLSISSGF
jgi:hypothetical protein